MYTIFKIVYDIYFSKMHSYAKTATLRQILE